MSIWTFFAKLFNSLFDATKEAWDELPAPVQAEIQNGSGIMSILDQYAGQDANLTIATINANYPTEANLYDGLAAVGKYYGITIPPDLPSLVVALQTYIKSKEGSDWDKWMSFGAMVLGDFLSGSETPWEIIITVIQWVYTNLIKPKTLTLVAAPTPNVSSNTTGALQNSSTPQSTGGLGSGSDSITQTEQEQANPPA